MQVIDLTECAQREQFPGYRGRFVHTERMTLVFWDVAAGARFPEHSHPHEQVVNVLEGEFELVVGGTGRRLQPGAIVVIPPHERHTGMAVTACRLLDVFAPVREDYK